MLNISMKEECNMKKIRKGNDIEILWSIYTKNPDGSTTPYVLGGKDLKLSAKISDTRVIEIKDFSVQDNKIVWLFKGKDQRYSGVYSLTLMENKSKDGMKTLDKCRAFSLVDCSCETNDDTIDNIQVSTTEFSSNIEFGGQGTQSVDLSGYVSTFKQSFSEPQKSQARENIGAISENYLEEALKEKQPKGDYPTKDEMSEAIADAQLGDGGNIDLSAYITESRADNKYQPKGSYQPKGDYPTSTEVDEKIAKAQLGGTGGSVDTSVFLTKTEADRAYQPKGANYLNLKGKTVSIIGDSISTFEGYLADSTYLKYFPKYDVTSVEQTWWKLMLNKSGMVLHKNCAWSGSYVTGSSSSTTNASAGCSTKRINDLAKDGIAPDIVICFIGINNLQTSTAGTELGNWKGGTLPAEGTINTFSEAYALMVSKILKKYPRTEVFLCTLLDTNKDGWDNDGTSFPTNKDSRTLKDYNDTIRFIAEAFGVNVIDVHACGVNWFNLGTLTADGLHPNAEGMKQIAKKMLAEISAKSTYAHPVDDIDGSDEPIVPTEYTVTYKYVDATGATIKADTTVKVEEGVTIYATINNAPSISGYSITSVTPSGSIVVSGDLTITYKYTANAVEPTPTYVVTYKYVDSEGNTIMADATETVVEGTSINASIDNAPTIDGYNIVSVNPSGSITINANTTVTYTYNKVEVEEPDEPEVPEIPSDYPTETTWYIDVATKSNLNSSFGKGGASYVYVDDALNGAVEGKYVNAFRCAFHTAGTFAYGKCNLDAQTYEKVGSIEVTSADLGKELHIFKVPPFKVEEGERIWFMDSEFAGKMYYQLSPSTSDGAFGYGITATNFTPTLNSNKNLSIDVGFVVE